MRFFSSDLFKLSAYLLGCLLLTTVASPIVYILGKSFAASAGQNEWITPLEWFGEKCDSAGFGRYFKRTLLFSSLILLYPLLVFLRAGELGGKRVQLGYRSEKPVSQCLRGFIIAVGIVFCASAIVLSMDYFSLRDRELTMVVITRILVSALVVSLVEEFIFRGWVQGLLRRSMSGLKLVFASALLFAAVHFFEPPKGASAPADVDMWMGWQFLRHAVSVFIESHNMIWLFFSLVIIGCLLGYAREKLGDIYLGIGYHFGLVMSYQLFSYLCIRDSHIKQDWWVGGSLKEGLVTLCFLILSLGIIMFYTRYAKKLTN